MLLNFQCDAAKMAAKTNRHSFACNYLEYNKLKASILTLHSKIGKQQATLCIKYSFQKKLRDIII